MQCFNCRAEVEQTYHVPEFDYQGCEACLTEALGVLAKDAAEAAPPAPKPVVPALTGTAWVLQQTAPYFAAIGNGLYVRTGERKTKRRAR